MNDEKLQKQFYELLESILAVKFGKKPTPQIIENVAMMIQLEAIKRKAELKSPTEE